LSTFRLPVRTQVILAGADDRRVGYELKGKNAAPGSKSVSSSTIGKLRLKLEYEIHQYLYVLFHS